MSFSLLRSPSSSLSCVLGLYSDWVELSNFLNTLQVDLFLEKMIVCVEGLFERGIKGSGRLSTGWKAVFKRGRAVTSASSLPNCLSQIHSGKQLFLFVSRLGPQHDTVSRTLELKLWLTPFMSDFLVPKFKHNSKTVSFLKLQKQDCYSSPHWRQILHSHLPCVSYLLVPHSVSHKLNSPCRNMASTYLGTQSPSETQS